MQVKLALLLVYDDLAMRVVKMAEEDDGQR